MILHTLLTQIGTHNITNTRGNTMARYELATHNDLDLATVFRTHFQAAARSADS